MRNNSRIPYNYHKTASNGNFPIDIFKDKSFDFNRSDSKNGKFIKENFTNKRCLNVSPSSIIPLLNVAITKKKLSRNMPRVQAKSTLKTIGNNNNNKTSMGTTQNTLTTWRNCDAVCFDVDSTVIVDEGLDQLAEFCDKGEIITQITQQAMQGGLEFREALAARLSILQPCLDTVQQFIRLKPPMLTPGIKELVATLHARGVDVYLVSGGFSSLIAPVAKQLNIPMDNVYANIIYFDADGQYAGFDKSQPTSRSGGKAEVVTSLLRSHGYRNIVMIGDGVTDMEAFPPAHGFIGFGGNITREAVKKHAPLYVYDFKTLIKELKHRD